MNMNALGLRVIDSCVQATILCLLVWLVTRLWKKMPSGTRSLLWWAVFLKLVLSLILPFGIKVRLPQSFGDSLVGISGLGLWMFPARPGVQAMNLRFEGWTVLLIWVWIVGCCVQLVRFAFQYVQVRRTIKGSQRIEEGLLAETVRTVSAEMGLPRAVPLYLNQQVTSPMVLGVWFPNLVCPSRFAEDYDEQQLRMAMSHELAHVRRSDLRLAIIPMLASIFFWFLPVVWLASREWMIEREAACDSIALQVSKSSPEAYGELLLKIVAQDRQTGIQPALGATSAFFSLKRRIQNMKSEQKTVNLGQKLMIGIVSLGLLILALPMQVTAGTPLRPTDGLLANGDFENGGNEITGWDRSALFGSWPSTISASFDSDVKHSGSQSLRFERTDARFVPVAVLSQAIKVPSGAKKLEITAWVKAENVMKGTMVIGSGETRGWAFYFGDPAGGSKSFTFDWTQFKAVVAVPEDVEDTYIAIDMYGKGVFWYDDVTVKVVPDSTPLTNPNDTLTKLGAKAKAADVPLSSVKSVSMAAGKDVNKKFFLLGDTTQKPFTDKGMGLVLIMPGGDGSAEFNPWCKSLHENVIPAGFLSAELVAPIWSKAQQDQVVWPTRRSGVAGVKFSTEDFVNSVIDELSAKYMIDPAHIYTLSWSSSGPAAYSISLECPRVKGSLVTMSVFRPEGMASLKLAKGHRYAIAHGDEDFIPMRFPEQAAKDLVANGANVKFEKFKGKHGWNQDLVLLCSEMMKWLIQR